MNSTQSPELERPETGTTGPAAVASGTNDQNQSAPTVRFADGPSHHRRSLVGAVTGSTLEVFDFTIYGTFAPFFAASFFAAGDPRTAFLQSLIVLAVGFVARPLGSLFFGHLSDTRGRRISLYATSATALTGTLLIALSPGHNLLGIGAAIVLIVARLLQGFAHGGEQPAAGAYVSEVAKPSNRGQWSSVVYMSILGGAVLGSLIGAVLSSWLGVDILREWAWRLPFLVGALGSVSALVAIHRMPETTVFRAEAAKVSAQQQGPGLIAPDVGCPSFGTADHRCHHRVDHRLPELGCHWSLLRGGAPFDCQPFAVGGGGGAGACLSDGGLVGKGLRSHRTQTGDAHRFHWCCPDHLSVHAHA